MNKEYWQEYYKDRDRQKESDFALFCLKHLPDGEITLVDVGAGDGRDSVFFSMYTTKVIAVEPVDTGMPTAEYGFEHAVGTLDEFAEEIQYLKLPKPNVIYARWFLHAVEREVEDILLDFTMKEKATLMAEFRVLGDVIEDDSHERRLIDPKKIAGKLLDRGFIIKHMEVGHGFSKQGNDDPKLCRLIAEYKGR